MDIATLDYPWLVRTHQAGPFTLHPISIRSWRALVHASNPLVCGGIVDLQAAVEFLWLHSNEFREAQLQDTATAAKIRDVAQSNFRKLVQDLILDGNDFFRTLIECVELQFEAALPPSRKSGSLWETISVCGSVVHDLASSYGWTIEYILDLPIAQVFQLVRCIVRDRVGEETYQVRYANRKDIAAISAQVAALNAAKKS